MIASLLILAAWFFGPLIVACTLAPRWERRVHAIDQRPPARRQSDYTLAR